MQLKRFTLSIIALVILGWCNVTAGVPQKLAYQIMVVNPSTGAIKANENVAIRLEIRKASADGTVAFGQDFTATTNNSGLCSVVLDVPEGTNLSDDDYYMVTIVDSKFSGASLMTSVPYALVANSLATNMTEEDLIGTWVFTRQSGDGDSTYRYTYIFNGNGTGSYNYIQEYSDGSDTDSESFNWNITSQGDLAIIYHAGTKDHRHVFTPTMESANQMWIAVAWNYDEQYLFTKQ